MRSYVINLATEAARLKWMAAQFARLGLEWCRIAAVDLRAQAKPAGKGQMTGPEIGCMKSHASAWRKIVESGDAYGAVFEDDVILSDKIRPLLEDHSWIPEGVELLRLETSLLEIPLSRHGIPCPAGTRLHRSFNNCGGAGGYIVSARKAAELLEKLETNELPIDLFLFPRLFESVIANDVIIHQIVPGVCLQTIRLADTGAAPSFDSAIAADGARFMCPHRSLARKLRDRILQIRLRWMLSARPCVVPFSYPSEMIPQPAREELP